MKVAEDFRSIARSVLSGKWKTAVLVGLVAMLLGGTGSNGPEIKVNLDASGANATFQFAGQTIYSTGGGLDSDIGRFLAGSITFIMVVSLIAAVLYFILGSIIKVGYAKFNLNLVDRLEGTFDNLFGYFSYWKEQTEGRCRDTLWFISQTTRMDCDDIVPICRYYMSALRWHGKKGMLGLLSLRA